MVQTTKQHSDDDDSSDAYVVLTRRRLDVYFVVGLLVSFAILGYFSIFTTITPWPLTFPAIYLLCLWLIIRFIWPKAGNSATRMSARPGAMPMLTIGAVAMAFLGGGIAVDHYVFGQRKGDTPQLYQLALYTPPFVLMFAGATWIDRRYSDKRPPKR
ncbi:hypothetical protein [Fuerstiella marisgermanici]|uniref:Transmembrane protein n=1 Tax=Fuerstiella marisgermanici TaxID=1891926 RepID=A0A1P8WHD8_9PLAN|nr:hypothetical protein [Fuerstiella marisgermanici]APZ93463.1 hypothetical protein Fuma_03081 [Fuerstiella marisgermanici]